MQRKEGHRDSGAENSTPKPEIFAPPLKFSFLYTSKYVPSYLRDSSPLFAKITILNNNKNSKLVLILIKMSSYAAIAQPPSTTIDPKWFRLCTGHATVSVPSQADTSVRCFYQDWRSASGRPPYRSRPPSLLSQQSARCYRRRVSGARSPTLPAWRHQTRNAGTTDTCRAQVARERRNDDRVHWLVGDGYLHGISGANVGQMDGRFEPTILR